MFGHRGCLSGRFPREDQMTQQQVAPPTTPYGEPISIELSPIHVIPPPISFNVRLGGRRPSP